MPFPSSLMTLKDCMPTGSFLYSLFAIIISPIPFFSRKDTVIFWIVQVFGK